MPDVHALLFDLGGVVIGIEFERVLRSWAPRSALSGDELRRRFHMDEAYERHERGEIDAAAYFEHVRSRLALEAADGEIVDGWNALFTGEITETTGYIREASRRIPCFAFSNSNPTHQSAWSAAYPDVEALFRRVFVSWDIGMRKPEPAAFEHVAGAIGVAPASVLFFDDSPENVRGAEAAGYQAVLVRDPADVKAALIGIGVLQGQEALTACRADPR